MNEASTDKPRQRIRSLMRDIQFIANAYEEFVDEDGDVAIQAKRHLLKPLAAAHNRMTKLFRRHKFFPLVWSFGGALVFQWCPISSPAGKFKGRWPPIAGDYSESQAVYEMTWMMPNDIKKLRECACSKWFYARFSHQRFCSSKCRERAFRSSEVWKAYRRRKAREYYQLHKSGKVK